MALLPPISSSFINTQYEVINQLKVPHGINLSTTGASLSPNVSGLLGYDINNKGVVYVSVATGFTGMWQAIGSTGIVGPTGIQGPTGPTGAQGSTGMLGGLAPFGNSPNADGATLISNILALQPATPSSPGGVSTKMQGFTGVKIFGGFTGGGGIAITSTVEMATTSFYNNPTFFDTAATSSGGGTLPGLTLICNGGANPNALTFLIVRIGRLLFFNIGNNNATFTSGGTPGGAMTCSNNGSAVANQVVPSAFLSTVAQMAPCIVVNSGVNLQGLVVVSATGFITFYSGITYTGFSNGQMNGLPSDVNSGATCFCISN